MLTSPLQLEIIEIPPRLACELNARWHSMLPHIPLSNIVRNPCYVCYAAQYNDKFYAVAIWSSPVALNRFKEKDILELRRLAISDSAPHNTASHMLSVMRKAIKKKFPRIKKLISYSLVGKGTIYKAAGWGVGAYVKSQSWTTRKRKRNLEQVKGDKIRWELEI